MNVEQERLLKGQAHEPAGANGGEHAQDHDEECGCGRDHDQPAPKQTQAPTRRPDIELSVDNLVPYLLDRQLLDPRAVNLGTLTILDLTRRNRGFKVIAEAGESVLVKQVKDIYGDHADATVNAEARVLRTFQDEPIFDEVRDAAPHILFHDRENSIFVTELVHPATSLTKLHLNVGDIQFPVDAAVAAARLVAGFHRAGAEAIRKSRLPRLGRVPLGLEVLRDYPGRPENIGPVGRLFWDRVRATTDILDPVVDLIRGWGLGERGFVHGDLRWDNVLLTHGLRDDDMNMRIIDWELTCVGEPGYDLAFFLGDYLRFWVLVATNRNLDEGGDLAEVTGFGPEAWRSSARTFWDTYCEHVDLGEEDRAARLEAVGRYLPYALLLYSWEMMSSAALNQGAKTILPGPVALLDLVQRFGENPERHLFDWFGMEVA